MHIRDTEEARVRKRRTGRRHNPRGSGVGNGHLIGHAQEGQLAVIL